MNLTGVIPLEIVLRPALAKADEKEVGLCCPTEGGATQLSLFLFLAVTRCRRTPFKIARAMLAEGRRANFRAARRRIGSLIGPGAYSASSN